MELSLKKNPYLSPAFDEIMNLRSINKTQLVYNLIWLFVVHTHAQTYTHTNNKK